MAANRPTAVAISASEMPGRHRLQAGGAHLAQILKGPDDAHHGAHQPDKWSDRSGGGQPVHVAFQLGEFFADAQLQRALERGAVGDAAARLHLALQFFVAEIEDRHQGRRAELLARHHHGFHAAGLAEGAQEAGVGLAGAAQGAELGENDRPGVDGKTDQYAQHSHAGGAAMLDHFPEICLQEEGNGSLEEQFVS